MHSSFFFLKIAYASGAASSGKRCEMMPLASMVPGADEVEQVRHVAAHVALAHAQGEALVHRRRRWAPGSHGGPYTPMIDDVPAAARRVDRPDERGRRARLELAASCRASSAARAGGLAADRVDAHVGAAPVGQLAQDRDARRHARAKSTVSTSVVAPGELEPVVDVIDGDDAAGAHQPRRLLREQADRPAAEHDDRVALPDARPSPPPVARRQDVAEEEHVLVVHVGRGSSSARRRRRARARARPARRRSRRSCASSRRCRRRCRASGWSCRTQA